MKNSYVNRFVIISVAIIWISAIGIYPFLPKEIPFHFGIHGEVDQYADKLSIFLLPIVMLGMIGIQYIIPKIDPKRDNYQKFRNSYQKIFSYLICFFGVVYLIMIILAFELFTININRVLCVAIGVFFILNGNLSPKIKPTHFTGLRVPWTLASEENWLYSNRFSGKVSVVSGIVIILAGLFSPAEWLFQITMAVIVFYAVISILYSYLYYVRKEKKKHD